jgi:hypothetical protein
VLNSGTNGPLVSRMLGGLQFAGSFSTIPENEGCLAAFKTCTPENALLSVLTAYFSGAYVGSLFPNGGTSTITVGSETVTNAPLNWLQIWDTDVRYALGWGNSNCRLAMFQNAPPKDGGPPKGCKPDDIFKHTVSADAGSRFGGLTAQQPLNIASAFILDETAVPVALPPTCCPAGYRFPRNAFVGDPVCVTADEEKTVASDNAATASNYSPGFNYTKVPTVPYGVCFFFRVPTRCAVLHPVPSGLHGPLRVRASRRCDADQKPKRHDFQPCPDGLSCAPIRPWAAAAATTSMIRETR